jgi:hypothetical protein
MAYHPLLMRVLNSGRTDPEWKAQEQTRHEQRMAQMRQNHQNQIASWNASNRRHEMRMKAIQDAGDASMRNWYANQAVGESNHRGFLNYISEEHTVVAGGKAFQVDNSHQKYFVNRADNSYVGTDSTASLDDLRKMGIDPSGYEEARIKR